MALIYIYLFGLVVFAIIAAATYQKLRLKLEKPQMLKVNGLKMFLGVALWPLTILAAFGLWWAEIVE
jgi:hypothetical protein